MNAKILPSSRSELDIYLKGNELKTKFHDLFDAYNICQAGNVKKQEKKKVKKRSKSKSKDKKSKRDKSPEVTETSPPTLEICGNPSQFTVYSTVRQSILEQCMKEASQIYHQSQSIPSDSDTDEEREEKIKEGTIKLPKIVGLGLTGVFELVRDTRHKYPELCVRALTALLDMLQGQQPESMKSEPPDVIENFFNLLMEISTEPGPDKDLSALTCSALLSLVTALGDTGKLLTAVSTMLMAPGALSSQDIVVPGILTGLQKSVQAVLLGKSILPDWLHQGIKVGSEIDRFTVEDLPYMTDNTQNCAIASDGQYLYLLNKEGLFKVGSGYRGTIKSHIYQYKKDFPNSSNSWLTCAGDQLFCRTDDNTHPCLSVVDSKTFDMKNSFHLDGKGQGPCALFSDGDYIGQIASAKDDSFVVRLYNPNVSPMSVVSELPLKLTRKCMDVFGSAGYDPETEKRSINTGFDEDSVFITSGKEFALVRTAGNKVLYTGRSQSLGIKQGGPSQGKWMELPITKSPKIVQISTGHEGQHALLVADDGSLFFVGTPKRGEDGDASSSKARRQPKAVKPKKIIRMETMSKHVVYTSCNNGSSGIVTKEGEVYIYGKDTTHCDHTTGQVTDLKDVMVTQIALGKAHAVVLTDRGQVYTFGINNKGQCGRDFQPGGSKEANNVNMAEEEEETEIEDNICPDGKHKWKRDQCMICTVCAECTGYGLNCCNSGDKDRQPSMPCGCGAGESGCSECGICRTCAGEQLAELEDHGKQLELLARHKELLPLDVEHLLGNDVKMNHIEDLRDSALGQFFKRLLSMKKEKPKRKEQAKQQPKAAEAHGNDPEADYNKVVSLPPQEICIGTGDIPVTQIACGQHHTVLLLQNGEVYVFGNNNHGQLGQGDTNIKGAPVHVDLPMGATQVAAGGHHTVVLLSNGQVFTFGNYKSGALGRGGPDEAGAKNKKALWYALPGAVPGIGARYGRRATWIGANGDQTFMRVDESLINAHILAASKVFANQTSIGLIPTGEENTAVMKCLMINKVDGSCRSFGGNDQVDLSKQAVCLDPVYDVLWSYSPENKEVSCFNSLVTEARPLTSQQQTCGLFKPELAVPVRMGHKASRSHCALHVLGCLDTLNIAQQLNLTVREEAKEKLSAAKVYSKEDFLVVNRFSSHGGGWGYSGHSIEAVRFMSDTDVLLGGFGLFGGRGEYYGRIKLFELGPDGGENETDGEMIAETDEVAYECGAREKHAMLFEEPVQIHANQWYVAWARISGPSSDCGSNGQPVITTDDQVVFKFKSSKKSNNGTDVNAGQIPQLLYRLPSRENSGVVRKVDCAEPAHILSPDFACTVTPECFDALLKLIQWSWTTFTTSIVEANGLKGDNYIAVMGDIKRLVYVNKACLRLIRTFVCQIYPDGTTSHKPVTESDKLSGCVGQTQDLLRTILAEEVQPSTKVRVYLSEPGSHSVFHTLEEEVLNECHITFRACFHAFYPTGNLKWLCLCDLLGMLEPEMLNIAGYGRLLAAVMEAMCHPTIRLTNIMPINSEPKTEEILRRQSVIMDDNTNSMARLNDQHRFPQLVAHMTYRMEMAGLGGNQVSFCEVLDKLLTIVTLPVRQELDKEESSYPSVLVDNTCALLSTIISELSATSIGLEMDLTTTSTPLLVTPNRFTRTSQSASWNTGNGSPDAISFSVDKPGIVIAGVCVYGGAGQYQYELELLDDISGGQNDPSPSQRWNNIEIVKGCYGTEDCVNDIAEIKFDKPISIKEGVKYTIRLKNHGPKTLNGDGGMNKVKCPDGTTFTFSACSLSSNGSNHTRGQIPQILYYSSPQDGENQQQSNKTLAELQARKNAIDIVGAICRMATDMLHRASSMSADVITRILGNSHLFSSLLPMILAHIGPVASQDPRGSVQVLGMIQEILPAVANLNNHISPPPPTTEPSADVIGGTTSQHYAIVESEHPYKPATVSHYKVTFPDTVKWMALEFDPSCGTAQNEDVLQLMIPSRCGSEVTSPPTTNKNEDFKTSQRFTSVFKKFSGCDNWPKHALILPGNQVVFSLETASDYIKDEKACFFGFKCVVVGYEWKLKAEETIAQLERELAYLGGMCAGSLIKKDISLPPVTVEELEEDMDYIEEGSLLVFNEHSKLLGKGFALSHPPTIMQALEGNLPFCWQSNERSFLKDFVSCSPGTSGGRMARWLQPDSYLDPSQCELVYKEEDLRCSWPALLTVLTKDQYGHLVQVTNLKDLKVEVKAIPVDQGILGDDSKKMRRLSRPDTGNMTFGGQPPPCLDVPYEPTIKDKKDVFHAICMMKQYENYSFEELRVAAPAVPRPSENMLVRSNNDGTYVVNWTPGSVGLYNILVTIDGFDTGEVYKVDVKDPPQGITPPSQTEKKPHHTNKLRKFVQKYSAGLRARTNPSLQSEQIGVIPPEGIISFVDEIHNDDGVWLRLSQDSIREYCTNGHIEGWVLQYNQHLGKTLLVPVEEPKSITKEFIKETIRRNLKAEVSKHKRGPGMYQVIKCGSFGHNIRCGPSLKSTPVGMLTMDDKILAIADKTNPDGHWIKIDPESAESFCQTKKGEFWSLVQGKEGIIYLQHEHDIKEGITPVENEPFSFSSPPNGTTSGFNFGASPQIPSVNSVFGALLASAPNGAFGRSASLPTNVFSFGFQGSTPSPAPTFGHRPMSNDYGTSFDSSFHSSDLTHTTSHPSFGSESPFTPSSASLSKFDMSVRSKSPMSMTRSPVSGSPKSSRRDPGIPPELHGVSVKDLVKALGESRANGNGPTPVPSPPGTPKKSGSRSSSPHLAPDATGSPRTGSPIRSLSPKLSKSDSKTVVSDSSSQASLKEETFTTPPDSPIPTRKTLLKKEPSFDRFSQSPPTSPVMKAKLSDASKDGRLSPSSAGFRDGLLSTSHATIPARRDSFGSPPPLPVKKDSVGSPVPQRRESFGSPRHTSPVRTISPQRGSPRRGSSPLLNYNSPRASPVMGSDQTGSPLLNYHSPRASPVMGSDLTAGDKYFNIGSGSAKDESPRMSPKLGRKERRQLRSKRDRPSSPSSKDTAPMSRNRSSSTSIILEKAKEPVKEALSPSVAECLRAVFAAFLWHEGIVHDAMACASFLKFHPDLNKEMSKFANKKKQERIRVRHATDSSKELNKKRENININEARVRFNLEPQFLRSDSERSDKSDKSDKSDTDKSGKSDSPISSRELKFHKKVERHKSEGSVNQFGHDETDKEKEKASALPLTLQHLVYFWEELSSGVLRVIYQDLVYPSPAVTLKAKKGEKKDKEKEKEKKSKKKKEPKQVIRVEAMVGIFGGGGAGAAAYKGDTWCELCGGTFPHPVTYHMRQSHPGCGRHAGGKGYNSSGNFCGGWAGNCGEGGYGGSGWYLICETCRDKYLKDKKQQQKEKDKAKKMKKKNAQSRAQAILSPQEPHVVLKSNAMFLLDLASASGFTLPIQSHKKHNNQNNTDLLLPSVYEEYGQELNPFPQVPFTFLVRQGAQNSDSAFADDFYIDAEERVFVRSGSMSIASKNISFTRPRLPTEPRHSPLARSGSLGQDIRPALSHISPPSPKDFHIENNSNAVDSIIVPKSAGTSPDSEVDQIPKKTAFQRSMSEYVSDDDSSQGNDRNYGKFSGRRRNNSGGVTDGGMSLLKHPSAAMAKLIQSVDKGGAENDGDRALQRPVMSFIVQRHDLEGLQLAMRQALRKAACRVFAMQALNWLLRSVTQMVCLHDLMWFFVASLTPPSEEEKEEEEEVDKGKEKEKEKKKKETKKDQEDALVCDHPLQDVTVAGQAVEPLLEVFHTLLQTTADVMMQLPWGSAIQQMAVHCFCLNFRPSDHQFLHESHVFSNISRILSKSEEESEEKSDSGQASYTICNLKDLTPSADIKVSSRQAMISSLTDNSTETFWESGDEDRNKTKTVTIICFMKAYPKSVYVHVDNTRDLASKVASITFQAGPSTDDLTKLEQIEVDTRFTGWLSCHIPEPKCRCVHLELKGPDHNLRIRQIKVLGEMEGENIYLPVKKSAVDLQQENCETETLRVFRMLTSQVFGKLIVDKEADTEEKKKSLEPADSMDGDHDLKEHMVGILFSRSKLSHLQKQVCSHIVQGIRKETCKIREEWESSLGTKTQTVSSNSDQDAYCFELLSMVLALSGSGVGRTYLAQQYPLLQDLFSLLHTGTPRIQRQVISVLRRVLPEAKPQTLASILSVPNLPPSEYSIVSLASREDENETYDVNKPGILDVLLACISKAVTVQTKVKASGPQKGVTSMTLAECQLDSLSASSTGSRWWMRGKMDSAMANNIISLIQDMASGCLSETWATVTKAAVAEAILALTKLDESLRVPQTCVKTPTLWLALSSLCVLDQDHVERLTSGQWVSSPNGQHGQPRPTCDNHDDGETQAIILCTDCGNLCADCDRYLHLPKRNRNHQRQVFKEEEEAIRVDLHEGCGRTKLFWLMALADSRTLKAMVEFREGKQSTSKTGPGVCRFCGATSNTGLLAIGNVCAEPDCQEYAKTACIKTLPCGHACRGIKDEEPCLPCLHRCGKHESLKQDADDMCMICFTEALSAAPAIQLKCNHVFHLHCSRRILSKRWVGPRITFGFSLCPICKSTIDHPVLRDLLKPIQELFEDVRRKAMMRLEYEGLHKAEAITTPGARFYQDPAGFAMDRYAYYVCFKCKKAYYGGEARCEEQAGALEDYDPQELVCGGCSDVSRAQVCPKHGTDFLEYKCRYCCSVAVFFCFGTTHFCNACHDDFQRITNIPKTELPRCPAGPRGKQMDGEECPLHVKHPPTGEEFALGCGVCRNAHTF